MRPSTLAVHIGEDVESFGIAPDTLFRMGGPSWNYFQFYRLEAGDHEWHGKLAEHTQSSSLEVHPAIAKALQLNSGAEVTIGISSDDPVKTVEYVYADKADPSWRICEGIEIHEGQVWLYQGKAIKIISCSPGYVTSHTKFKRVDSQQDPDQADVTTLDEDPANEKPGFARLAGSHPAIEEIEQQLLMPIRHPDWADRFKVSPISGALLVGPDGVGKKPVARAIGEELGWKTRWIRPADLLEPAALENKLNEAEATGENLLIVIEGLDELQSADLTERRSILATRQFLESTKNDNHILTIGLAERHPDIHPKLKGVGRFELVINLPKPNRSQRAALFRDQLLGVVKDESDVDYVALADQTEGFTRQDIQRVADKVKLQAMIDAASSTTDPPINTSRILEVLTDTNQHIHRKTTN